MAFVDRFDEANWATGERLREAAGYYGTVRDFALLAKAIGCANRDDGGLRLLADEDGEITAIEVFDDPATRRAEAEIGPKSIIHLSTPSRLEGGAS